MNEQQTDHSGRPRRRRRLRWTRREESRREVIKRGLRRWFDSIWVESTVAVLVLASVVLTLLELGLEISGLPYYDGRITTLAIVNEVITWIFVVELSLRFYIATSKVRFFREFWIDILAVLPLFRIFRAGRALRLLRLVRVLRLLGVMNRIASSYPYVFRRGMMEYIAIIGLLSVTVIFGTISMMYFENPALRARRDLQRLGVASTERQESSAATGSNAVDVPAVAAAGEAKPVELPADETFTLENSFWFSLYSLFAGEPVPLTPQSRGGKIVAVFVMFMGLTIFAMFTGTVSAYMVERFRTEGRVIHFDDLTDHIIVCGWNHKTEIIIREYRASKRTRAIPIVVIAEADPEQTGMSDYVRSQIGYLQDDFTRVEALERAGVHRAKTCIVLSDTSGGRSDQDADARTILAALTVEKINPTCYTCAEIIHESYGSHLEMGNVNDYVVSGDYSAYMLAQAALNRGLMGVIGELLTYQRGNEFYRYPLPKAWLGMTFTQLMLKLKQEYNAILVAVHPQGGEMSVNPADHTFTSGDEIVVIASSDTDLTNVKE